MSRVLIVGWELPEYSPSARVEAANFRTAQVVGALRTKGHDILVVAGRIGGDFPAGALATEKRGHLTYIPVRFSRPGWMRRVQAIHDAFRPDCMVGVTFLGALRSTRIRSDAPLWADIYGDQMAEMQVAARPKRSDRGIATEISFFRDILRRGDAYSTCSAAQRFALIGQLSMVGRLNSATFGYEFVHVLPPSSALVADSGRSGVLRGTVVPSHSRVVLWCGGYNYWTDVETLYQGLELAMEIDPDLHFVSVGDAVSGCDSYARFCGMVRASSHSERYRLLGWQPSSVVPNYYRDADIAVTVDAACYEAELGTRTRLVEMMHYGLPPVTTLACELSYAIRDEGLGLTFPVGDWRALGRHIAKLSQHPEIRREMAERALNYAETTLSLENATSPLRQWVESPQVAPDRRQDARDQVYSRRHSSRTAARRLLWTVAGLDQ
jgi:hypothetical protein